MSTQWQHKILFFYFEFLFNFHLLIQQEAVLKNNIIAYHLAKLFLSFMHFSLPFPFDFLKRLKLRENVLESKLQKIVQFFLHDVILIFEYLYNNRLIFSKDNFCKK